MNSHVRYSFFFFADTLTKIEKSHLHVIVSPEKDIRRINIAGKTKKKRKKKSISRYFKKCKRKNRRKQLC